MKVFFGLSILFLVTLICVNCGSEPNGQLSTVDSTTNNNQSETFESTVDRAAAIQECAKCHQEAYDNWLLGPHANAYKSLMEHVHKVNKTNTFSVDYRDNLNKQYDKVCVSCHTGQNLFDNVFKGLDKESNSAHFNTKYFPNMHKRAYELNARSTAELSTGVDCLTCHQSGENIVTNSGYTGNTKMNNQCNLIASKFFSSNENCYTCHFHQVESSKEIAKREGVKEKRCSECHMERTEDGKMTHYYFWRNDSDLKARPVSLGMFSSVKAIVKSSNGRKELNYSWINDYIPHQFSECGEAVLSIQIIDKNGKLIAERKERVNNKKNFEKDKIRKYFREGIEGNQFNYKQNGIEGNIPLNLDSSGGKIILKGLVKPQFWSSDEELKQVYLKEINI